MMAFMTFMAFITFMTSMTHGNVIFDILELAEFRKYSTDWVLQKFEEPCRIYKKYANVNVKCNDDMMIC